MGASVEGAATVGGSDGRSGEGELLAHLGSSNDDTHLFTYMGWCTVLDGERDRDGPERVGAEARPRNDGVRRCVVHDRCQRSAVQRTKDIRKGSSNCQQSNTLSFILRCTLNPLNITGDLGRGEVSDRYMALSLSLSLSLSLVPG